jgi:hypothetical protein
VEPMRNPTLFEMEKLEDAAKPVSELKIERPYSLPGILLGSSAFTADRWQGSFYPPGMKSRDFVSYYATQFATIEVDPTLYGCPSPSTVNNWASRTPDDFIFSVKVPQLCGVENYVATRSERPCFRTVLDLETECPSLFRPASRTRYP